MDKHEEYTREETEQRLRKIMLAAFSGPPTPLKDIPKRNGKARASRVKAATRKAGKARLSPQIRARRNLALSSP